MTQTIANAEKTPLRAMLSRGRLVRARPSASNLKQLHAARLTLLGELATTIGHEISQPLAAIGMDAETLLRLIEQPDVHAVKIRQIIERVAENCGRAGDLVSRIRDMGRRQETVLKQINLNQIIAQSELLVRPHIEAGLIAFDISPDPELPDIIGDPVQLEQVVVNLLINCLQATAQTSGAKRIELRSRGEVGRVVVTVRDNGPGIPAEDRDKIFEDYYSTKIDGLGIGLSICRSILDLHRGGIRARNHPDGGAEFRFWVPVSRRFKASGLEMCSS